MLFYFVAFMSALNKEEINQSNKNRYKIFNWIGTYFSFITSGEEMLEWQKRVTHTIAFLW